MSDMPLDITPQVMILEARFKNLDRVRTFVAEFAEAYELGSAGVYRVQLAVDEAFTNIVEHAYGGESDEKIECSCQITDDGLVITLRDCGQPFIPEEVPAPDIEADLEQREVGGLGLFFIRQLMDEVEFKFINQGVEKPRCNMLRMVKRKENPV
jgi:serine/threonine-protein kinase RsbW